MIHNNEAPSTPVNQPIQMNFPVTPENQINLGAIIAPDIHEERRQAALVARAQRNFVVRPIRLTLGLPKPVATLNPGCKKAEFSSDNYPNGGGNSSIRVC